MATGPTVFEALLTNDVSGSAKIGPAKASRCKEFVVYIEFTAGTSAGIYKVESAAYEAFAGTWKSLGDLTWAAANSQVSLNFTGIHGAIRVRNTTPVAGGAGAHAFLIGRE